MIATNNQMVFKWVRLFPPDDPAKTVEVRPHWRRLPRTRRNRETGLAPRITEVKPILRKEV